MATRDDEAIFCKSNDESDFSDWIQDSKNQMLIEIHFASANSAIIGFVA